MSLNDTLSNALSKILNSEKISKTECVIKPVSKLIKNTLNIMKDNGYIGSFEEIGDGGGNFIKINLLGGINKCGSIKPVYAVKKNGYEKFEKRYLPAKGFGLIIVSTPKGLMTHDEARKKGLGGRLIAYCY